MTFEHHKKPLLSRKEFARRQARYAGFSMLIFIFSVSIGTAGYHVFANLPLIDAFLNASMILTGMGPVDHIDSTAGKLFAAFYSLVFGHFVPDFGGCAVCTGVPPVFA
jgi:hypothetical protein